MTTSSSPAARPSAGLREQALAGAAGGGWRSAFMFWWTSYARLWRGQLMSSFGAPLIFLGAMGYGLGRLVDDGTGGAVGGVPYVQFVAPGVLAATAMQTAVGESTFPVMGAIKWTRQYDAMLASPLGIDAVLGGHLAYVAARLTLVATVFTAVAAALGAVPSPWAVLAVPAAALTGLAFATPVFAFAASSEGEQGFNVLFRFVVTPLFLFSGTFFPVEQLPGWMQPVAWATPLFHGVELCRELVLGTVGPDVVLHLAYLVVLTVVGVLLARWRFARRLTS